MSLAWLKVDVVLGSIGKFAAASLLLATLGVTGCGSDPVKAGVAKGCTLNSDCNGGLVCSFGLCHQECEATTDCPAGQRCVQSDQSNVCQLTDEAQCHFNTDCATPLVCAIDLQCRNQCKGDADCLKGQTCADNVCAEPAEVTEDGGLKGAMPGAGGEGAGGGSNQSGGGTGAGGTVGAGGDNPLGDAGMPSMMTCTPGADCVPEGKPCEVGTIACNGNQAVCMSTGNADDGTDCGKDSVCSAGACVACKIGAACQPDPNNACAAGVLSCATGPSCDPSGNVTDGTGCGTDQVCSSGACVACKAGDACDPPGQLCKNGVLDCSAGPVCNPTTKKAAGSSCDVGKVCDSGAACVACVQDGTCSPPGFECHQGKQDCTNGPICNDTQLPVNDGLSCTGVAAYNFCTGGVCSACQSNTACTPANVCHKGLWNCQTTPPTCVDQNTNATDGLTCGANKSCISGSCLTNDRTLTVTSGAVPDTAIDNTFAPVTVHLVDGNNANVQGAAVTVTASAGAYAVASAGTNASGNAQITGRVGRAVGAYKFTVSAPGATSIEFSVNAIATAAKNIFTVTNVNYLSGTATAPGPGTVSKLYGEARAVTAATDGTLYIADYCAVFQLTPAGVLTRVAGDANSACGYSGDSGSATQAKLYYPEALALDEVHSYLYIADTSNYRVRQVDLNTGTILTLAGGGANNAKPWGDNGPADSAYVVPHNVAVAPNGDVYISDSNSGSIRKVDYNSGVITTAVAPVGCNTNGPLALYSCGGYRDPCSMAWDKTGKMFISGYMCGGGIGGFRAVARVEGDGSLSLVAGSSTVGAAEGGTATSAGFTYSPYIAFDKAGNLFLSTSYDQRVRRIDALTTKITTVAGTGTGVAASGDYAVGSAAGVNYPTTLAFDGAGNLYFADSDNYAIRTVYGIGNTVAPTGTLATTSGTGQTVKRDAPFGALVVKLTDGNNTAVSGVNVQWKRVETGSGLGASGATALAAKTIASGSSAMTGRVGLASGAYHFEASYADIHGTPVTGSPQTFSVTAADPDPGIIFPVVNYVHTSGTGGYPGPATFAKLQNYVLGVVAASDGTIYASDQCAVYMITAKGEASVFAGTPGNCGFAGDSGPAVGAKLYYPEGMALDETNGLLYIADYQNQRIRSVDLSTGVITTFAGGGSVAVAPYGDGGDATVANIYYPSSVSVDPNGLVYIPDYGHNRIRVVDPATGIISTWLAGNTTCVIGTVQVYSIPQFGVVRFKSDGSAYIGANICQGTTTNSPLGIALRATNGTMTRVAGLYNGITTENADATATAFSDLSDIIIDGSGNLVVAMNGAHRIRKIDMTTGKINTVAGNGTAGYSLPADVTPDPGAYVAATGVEL